MTFHQLNSIEIRNSISESPPLTKEDFLRGFKELDETILRDSFLSTFITAFNPLRLLTAGPLYAVNYIESRPSYPAAEFIMEPEWVNDPDMKIPFLEAIARVSETLNLSKTWMVEEPQLYLTKEIRNRLFDRAEREQLVIFKGRFFHIYASPIEWPLERRMRSIYGTSGPETDLEIIDALAILKRMRDKAGDVLDREYIRTLNINGFDMVPDTFTMDLVERAYRAKYGEEIFTPFDKNKYGLRNQRPDLIL
ncbi:hypothetical protein FQN57_006462 [Myotisia sp. PD_48]|nr:hypothetical protein FQN57_006462 [Myotisia sp. PD_48]